MLTKKLFIIKIKVEKQIIKPLLASHKGAVT